MSKHQHGIAFPDTHFPREDKASVAAVETFASEYEWDWFTQLGDLGNYDSISRHVKNDLLAQVGDTVAAEYDAQNVALDRWDKIFHPKTKKYILEGNHDVRPDVFAREHPQVRGLIDNVPKQLHLADRGYVWIPSWSKGAVLTIGKIHFIHGYSVAENSAKINYNAYQKNIFSGHTHGCEMYSPKLKSAGDRPVAQSCGHLQIPDPEYMRGNPSRWQQAFVEFWVRPDGYFHYHIHRIYKNSFIANGKLYDGRAILKGRR